MAAVDKIYGTRKEWRSLEKFLSSKRPEYLRHLYPSPNEGVGPISNFTQEADEWLLKNCDLDFVIKAIKDQYNME